LSDEGIGVRTTGRKLLGGFGDAKGFTTGRPLSDQNNPVEVDRSAEHQEVKM